MIYIFIYKNKVDESISSFLFFSTEANKIEQDYPQRYQQTSSSDFVSPSYDSGTLPKHYGLSTSLYDDVNYSVCFC